MIHWSKPNADGVTIARNVTGLTIQRQIEPGLEPAYFVCIDGVHMSITSSHGMAKRLAEQIVDRYLRGHLIAPASDQP